MSLIRKRSETKYSSARDVARAIRRFNRWMRSNPDKIAPRHIVNNYRMAMQVVMSET